MNRIKSLSGSPAFTAIAIIFALFLKTIISYAYFSLIGDKSLYTHMSLNILEGHGYTETYYFIKGEPVEYLSNPARMTPAYNLLQVFFLFISQKNILLSSLLIDILGWLVLLLAVRKIVRAFCPSHIANLAVIVVGVFLYPHELSSPVKDTLAMGCMLWCAVYIMQLSSKVRNPFLQGVSLSVLAILPGLIKLIYLPVSLFLILPLLLVGMKTGNKSLKQTFWWSLGALCLLVIIHFAIYSSFQKTSVTGLDNLRFSTYQNYLGNGFFPENAKHLYPFIVTAFINLDLVGTQLRILTGIPFKSFSLFFAILNWIALAWLSVKTILKARILVNAMNPLRMFTLVAAVVSAALIAMQFILSIRSDLVVYKTGGFWTYVMEGRHYLYIMIILQLLLFVAYTRKWYNQPGKYLLIAVVSLFAFTLLHGFYFRIKTLTQAKEVHASKTRNFFYDILQSVDSLQASEPGQKVRLMTDVEHLKWLGLLRNDTVFCRVPDLLDTSFRLPSSTTLVTVIYNEDRKKLDGYMKRNNVVTWKEMQGYTLLKEN